MYRYLFLIHAGPKTFVIEALLPNTYNTNVTEYDVVFIIKKKKNIYKLEVSKSSIRDLHGPRSN